MESKEPRCSTIMNIVHVLEALYQPFLCGVNKRLLHCFLSYLKVFIFKDYGFRVTDLLRLV